MVDAARQMLDELMGRNRNAAPTDKPRKIHWDDPDFCQYYMVKFCPHDLFVNTRADLGPCPKIHDDEAKGMFTEAKRGSRKRQFEDDFIRFCNNMINEVDRKIQKGRQRLLLMNKGEGTNPPIYISKYQEQLNNLNARIKKLLTEAEEAGLRGDVDQAQGLTTLCEQLKEEKKALLSQHDNGSPSTGPDVAAVKAAIPNWVPDANGTQEKQMEVCEVCGAFLIVGDAQQRIEDHLMGKQHLGYSKVRAAVEEFHEMRRKEREDEEKKREEERTKRAGRSHSHRSDKERSVREKSRERVRRSRDDEHDRHSGVKDDRRDRRHKSTSERHNSDRRRSPDRERQKRERNNWRRSRSRSRSAGRR